MNKTPPTIIVCKNGMRLCKDGWVRDFAIFGTPRWTVKCYTSLGHARRRAKAIGGKVAVIPHDMIVDTSVIIEEIPCPDKPGYVTYRHHAIEEFFEKETPKEY